MWDSFFHKMLSRLILSGTLRVTGPDGQTRSYGPGGGPEAGLRITDAATLRALCLSPELALGEGYMNGTILVESDDLDGLLRLLVRNRQLGEMPGWVRAAEKARFAWQAWMRRNSPQKAQANVAHHYDLSNDFYQLWLDSDLQYSCGYFADPGMTLEEAQAAKKAHIAAKLRIEPGMHVLDIGCGWGGMALTLARDYGARVTGVTLSNNQLGLARARVAEAGLEDRITLRLLDYRALDERFDRIVSVGMLEHVGVPHYDEYFAKVSELLDRDGVALIHTIGRGCPPAPVSKWIDKYIFPGGYIPSLSELAGPIENSGLWNLDIENWRLHYAYTIRHWRERFEAQIETVRNNYDERFIRMWRYYLTACIASFEEHYQSVFQFQLGHRRDAVPLTRDYLYQQPQSDRERQAAE